MKKILVSALVAFSLVGVASLAQAAVLTRQLEIGMSGSDVSTLQTFLAQDPTIYPQGLVTGYFGSLTKSAVSNFQARNGIETVGRVGPITLAAINAKMNGSAGADIYAPTISGIAINSSANSANVRWNTSEAAQGTVYYSGSFPAMTENFNDVTIGGNIARTDTSFRTSQDVAISGLQANSNYFYVIYTKDAAGNVTMTWPVTFRTQP